MPYWYSPPLLAAGGYLVVPLVSATYLQFSYAFHSQAAANQLLPYARASVAQRELLLAYLRQRLPYHYPTLSPAAWLRGLFKFQSTLVLTDSDSVTLDPLELQQLVNHLSNSSELPLLDQPVYSLPTLNLANAGCMAKNWRLRYYLS
jgi:hypothetical protein